MAQAIWSTSKGRFLEITDTYGTNATRFGNSHIDILLALFTPIFYFYPSIKILMVSQIVVIGLGAVALFMIARKYLNNIWAASLIATSYLLHPAIQNMAIADFHGIIFSSTFLLFAFYLIETVEPVSNKTRRVTSSRVKLVFMWTFILLALMGREDISLIVALLGLYTWFLKKRVRLGVTMLAIGLIWFLVGFLVIIPRYGEVRVQSQKEFTKLLGMEGVETSSGLTQNFFLEHFEELGESYGDIVRNIFIKPKIFFGKLFEVGNIKYINKIAQPLIYLSYLSPHIIAISSPNLLISFLGEGSRYRSLFYHHVSVPTAFFFVAAIVSIYWVGRLMKKSLANKPEGLGDFKPFGLGVEKIVVFVMSLSVFSSSLVYADNESARIYPHMRNIVNSRIERHIPWIYSLSFIPKREITKEEMVVVITEEEEVLKKEKRDVEIKIEEEVIEKTKEDPNWTSLKMTDPRANNAAKEVLELIPSDASVSVPNYLGAYTATREGNALFPANYNSADFIVVDLFTPQFVRDLGNLEVNLIIPDLTKNLILDSSYSLIYSGGGIVVFERLENDDPVMLLENSNFDYESDGFIEFGNLGMRLYGRQIPERVEVGRNVSFVYHWAKSAENNFKRVLITTLINKSTGQVYQEVHLPSFALSEIKDWNIGELRKETFEMKIPKSIRGGEYEVFAGVKSIVGESIIGYKIGEVEVINNFQE